MSLMAWPFQAHPTSLPGPHGIGELGPEALRFVAFLKEAGQGIWQVLPLGPTGPEGSPYSAYSAFAGSPLLVSTDRRFSRYFPRPSARRLFEGLSSSMTVKICEPPLTTILTKPRLSARLLGMVV